MESLIILLLKPLFSKEMKDHISYLINKTNIKLMCGILNTSCDKLMFYEALDSKVFSLINCNQIKKFYGIEVQIVTKESEEKYNRNKKR